MTPVRLFTIGFTHKTAEQFFSALRTAGVKRVIDIRLNNVSQLAGFAKRDDLSYFLSVIGGIDYVHRPDLAPTQGLLEAYRKPKGEWGAFERGFRSLCVERAMESLVSRDMLADACLLCSEPAPDRCHRRLVAEYLRDRMGDIEICHL